MFDRSWSFETSIQEQTDTFFESSNQQTQSEQSGEDFIQGSMIPALLIFFSV